MKKYLILGPGGMGYFALLGILKYIGDERLQNIQEFAGSSAGSILAVLLGMGWSVDKIIEMSFSMNVGEHMKYSIRGIIADYGLIGHASIKSELITILGCDPTFKEVEKKIHIAAFCVDRSTTVYFSQDTHPDMSVLDAVCMSISVPFLFSAFKYDDHLYVDGGLVESIPYPPFMNKSIEDVLSLTINYNNNTSSDGITDLKQYIQTLGQSMLSNRIEYDTIPGIAVDIDNVNIFDFSMDDETKIKLYTLGFETGLSNRLVW